MPQSESPTDSQTAPTGPFAALRCSNFRLFFAGQLVSVAGSWMQSVAQQWLVYSLTHSPKWLGIVAGASAIPYVLFAVWGGQVADDRPRRNVLIVTQVAAMLLALALFVVADGRWVSPQAWHVAVIAAIGGAINAFTMPAQHALVTELIDDPKLIGNAIALNSLRFNMARFVGPILAGWVLSRYGLPFCFLANAASFLAVIASLAAMRLPAAQPRGHQSAPWGGFLFIARTPSILRVVTLVSLGSLFAWSTTTLYPVLAAQFHRGAGGFSAIMAAHGAGAAAGGLLVAWYGSRFERAHLTYGGAALFGVALLMLTAMRSFGALLAVLVVAGFAMIMFGINAQTKVQQDAPDRLRGRVMAVYSLMFNAMMPLGGLQIGFLAEHVGATQAIRLNAAVLLVAAAAIIAWHRADGGTGRTAPPVSPASA